METSLWICIGNGRFAAQSEQCGEKLRHPTATPGATHCKANLDKRKGQE